MGLGSLLQGIGILLVMAGVTFVTTVASRRAEARYS
jgi:hypothetical protein